MRSTLVELGPWSPWVAVLLAAVGAAGLVYLDYRGRRADDQEPALSPMRALAMGIIGAALGVGIYLAVNHFGPVKVRSWGTALMVGFAAALAWIVWKTRHDEDISFETLVDLCIVILVGAVVGARLVSALLSWDYFAGHPERLLRVWEGGLSFHGGLIGGWIAGSILVVRRKLGYGRIVDLAAPAIALGYAITRVGCFLNACCYGVPTDLPWGVCFHELGAVEGAIPRHPAQLYAAGINLAIFFLLGWIKPHLRRSGHLGLVYLLLYSAYRFGIEYLRRGATAEAFGPIPALTEAQAASILIAAFAGGWLLIDWIITRPRGGQAEAEHDD